MKIAVGNSRMDKKWKNQDISWVDLCARCGSTIRTTETVEEYRKLKKGQQDGIKDVGGFVGGHLREGRRKKRHGAVPLSAHTGYGLRYPRHLGRNYAVPRLQVLRLFHP